MADNPLSARAGLSVGDFKAGINEMNRDLRVLSSEFKASAASLGDWSKSATGLEDRIGFLNKSIDIQKQKIEALKGQMEAEAKAGKETAASKAELTIKINKATESLNEMQREVGEDEQSLAKMKKGTDETGKSVQELGNKSASASEGLKGLFTVLKTGLGAIVAVAGAVVALTGAIGGLVFTTADAAGQLADLSAKTGFSTTQLQEMSFVGNQLGVSLDTITGAQSKLIRSMSTATTQQADYNKKIAETTDPLKAAEIALGDSAAAFKTLGVSVTDSAGNLRSSQDVYAETIDALGRITNPAERDALAMSIFGKSAMELNPLIKTGSAEMAEMAKRGHELGAVMSDETRSAFDKFGDTVDGLKDGLKGTLGELAGAFLPGFQMVFDQAGGYLQEFTAIVKGSDGDIGKIATGVIGLIQKIVADIAAQAPGLLQSGLTILQTIITSIVTGLPTMLPVVIQLLMTLIQFIVTNLPMIIDAALQIVIALAKGITNAIPTLIPTIAKIIPEIILMLLQNLPLLIQAALALIMALLQGIQQATPELYAAMPVIVKAMFDALIVVGPMLGTAGWELIKLLAQGVWDSMPLMIDAIGGIVVEIFAGLYRGFQTNMPKFLAQVKGFFADIVKAAKSALGISSPSSEGISIGKNFIGSVGLGGESEQGALQRKMGAVIGSIARNYSAEVNLNGSASGGRAGGQIINIGDIYVDARGATDPRSVGQAVSESVLGKLRARGVS